MAKLTKSAIEKATRIWFFTRMGVFDHPNKDYIKEVIDNADFNRCSEEVQEVILKIAEMIDPKMVSEEPWVNCEERMPTEDDADGNGDVLWLRLGTAMPVRVKHGKPFDAKFWKVAEDSPQWYNLEHPLENV